MFPERLAASVHNALIARGLVPPEAPLSRSISVLRQSHATLHSYLGESIQIEAGGGDALQRAAQKFQTAIAHNVATDTSEEASLQAVCDALASGNPLPLIEI